MSKQTKTEPAVPVAKKSRRKGSALGRFLGRTLLVVLTLILLAALGLGMFTHTVLTGPSPAARHVLTATLCHYSATDWIPGLFLEEAQIMEILAEEDVEFPDFWPFGPNMEG